MVDAETDVETAAKVTMESVEDKYVADNEVVDEAKKEVNMDVKTNVKKWRTRQKRRRTGTRR